MAAPYPDQQHCTHAAEGGQLPVDGVAATIADKHGAIVITVTRHVEALPPDAAVHTALTVVTADGDIDFDSAPLLRAALTQALDGRNTVCCDLRGVTFFGAAAASTLLHAHRRATGQGLTFLVRGAHGPHAPGLEHPRPGQGHRSPAVKHTVIVRRRTEE